MTHTHADIARKRIYYVNLDEAFFTFARVECGRDDVGPLLNELERTIRAQHGQAQRVLSASRHPRPIWELATSSLRFRYQVLAHTIEVGCIWSKATGRAYEPKHDLMAEFSR